MIQLFQDSTDILPYYVHIGNYATAVSILIAVLITAVVFLWRKLTALEGLFLNMVKDGSDVLARVAQRLEDQQLMKQKQTEIINKLNDNTEILKEIKSLK
jgi:hypothetical protein